MSIYGKAVRELFKDFIKDISPSKDTIINRKEVFAWFGKNYPKIK